MSLNLVSPGIKVREVDLTVGRIDAVNDQIGALVGPFVKGPVEVPVLVETEKDLVDTFNDAIVSTINMIVPESRIRNTSCLIGRIKSSQNTIR